MNTAVSDELISRNPCTIRGAGMERARERPMLDTATVLALADAIEPRLRCLILLGGFGGLRTGELLGLQRRDVDPLHGTVMVVRQAHEITGPGRVLTPPKSDAGRRTVSLPAFVLKTLEAHLRDNVGVGVDAWVFTRPSGLPLRRACRPLVRVEGSMRRPRPGRVSVPTTSVTTPPRSSRGIPT